MSRGASSSAEISEDLVDDAVDVGGATTVVCRHPAVELGALDEDLAADLVGGQRVAGVLEQIAQPANAQGAVHRERLQRQEGVELR
jgi:hypothetical protein